MRERLLANLRKLPQILEGWNGPEDNDLQTSQFAKAVTKVLQFFLNRKRCYSLVDYQWKLSFYYFVANFHLHLYKVMKSPNAYMYCFKMSMGSFVA